MYGEKKSLERVITVLMCVRACVCLCKLFLRRLKIDVVGRALAWATCREIGDQ